MDQRPSVEVTMQGLKESWKGVSFLVLLLVGAIVAFQIFSHLRPIRDLKDPEEQKRRVAALTIQDDISRCTEARGTVIDGRDYEVVCRNNIALRRATVERDPQYCEWVDDTYASKEFCLQEASRQYGLDKGVAACEAFEDEARAVCVQEYWSQRAVVEDQIGLCDNIFSERDQGYCRIHFATVLLQRDPQAVDCASMLTPVADACQFYQSIVLDPSAKPEMCAEVRDGQLQEMCYSVMTHARP